MANLKQLRLRLGLSQEEFAGILGLDRARVSMAESGRRKLPYAVRDQIARMVDYLNNQGPNHLQERDLDSRLVENEIRRLEVLLDRLKLKLEQHQETSSQYQNLLHIKEEILFPMEGPVPAKGEKWWEVVMAKRKSKWEKNSPSSITILQSTVIGLEASLRFLKGEG
jgi:transcriptional regulator with XRE-family HTH domain